MDIELELKSLILELLPRENPVLQITDNTNLMEDLNYDSLTIVRLIAEIEERFNLTFEDDDLNFSLINKFDTLCNIVRTRTKGHL